MSADLQSAPLDRLLPAPRARPRPHVARRWLATFLAYPPSGLLALAVVGRVDSTEAALVGGAIAGAGIGLAQAAALAPRVRPRAAALWWAVGTAAAMAAGLAAGASAVDHRTSLGALAAMGACTGAVLGVTQGPLLRRLTGASKRRALLWASAQPALWALGWTVTTLAGVDVDRQYAVFGATGALAVAAVGAAFHRTATYPTGPEGRETTP